MTVVLAHIPNAAAEPAFETALEQALYRRTNVVLVNATRGESLVDPKFASAESLTDLHRRADERGVMLGIERPVGPDIPGAVLAVATQNKADLIVLGVRHRSAVGKFLLGSVAQRIILDAECPVLSVKSEQD